MAERPTLAEERHMRTGAESLFGGFRLGRVAGIEIVVDWSLLVIFAMVLTSLGWQILPMWHPDWSRALRWSVALIAAVSFFASILLHELSHALVGRTQGIRIERITLFLFGGVAHMEDESPSPKAELLMAIVGPLTSLAIGGLSLGIALFSLGRARSQMLVEEPEAAIAALGAGATVLLWLGPINLSLGIFNMVPGFPLDGGRVFRAIAWWVTGDLKKATRWATAAGRGVGILMMGTGAAMALGMRVPFFGRGLGSGVWLLLIGWFLYKAAQAGYGQLLLREALQHLRVWQIMRRRVDSVPPHATLDQLMTDCVLQSDQETFPVVENGRILGVVSAREALGIPAGEWRTTSVASVMMPIERVPTVAPSTDVQHAMEKLSHEHVAQLPVVDHGELCGILRQRDVFKWLTFRETQQAQ
jgi:Zn-dependent protease/CBS domain-containing protein